MLPNNHSLHLLSPRTTRRHQIRICAAANIQPGIYPRQISNSPMRYCAELWSLWKVMGAGWIYAIHIVKSVVIDFQVDQSLKANTGFSHLVSQTFWRLRFSSTPSLPFMPNSYIYTHQYHRSNIFHKDFSRTESIPPAVQILMRHAYAKSLGHDACLPTWTSAPNWKSTLPSLRIIGKKRRKRWTMISEWVLTVIYRSVFFFRWSLVPKACDAHPHLFGKFRGFSYDCNVFWQWYIRARPRVAFRILFPEFCRYVNPYRHLSFCGPGTGFIWV